MIFDEIYDSPEQLRKGMQTLLEQAEQYGISMRYCKEENGEEYFDGEIKPGPRREEAIVWFYTENRRAWLAHYCKMLWHKRKEFSCTDERSA